MSRVTGRARKNIIRTLVMITLAILATGFVVATSRSVSEQPALLSSCMQEVKENREPNGLWTDNCAGQWMMNKTLVRRDGQSFNLVRHSYQLNSPIPITMAYYDLEVKADDAYDPGATKSTRGPRLVRTFYYDGSEQLNFTFPPSEVAKTCQYRVVLLVGFNPQSSETPEPGKLVTTSKRVLGMADHTTDSELQERCNLAPTSRQPS